MSTFTKQIRQRTAKLAKLAHAGEFAHPLVLGQHKFAVPSTEGKLAYAAPDAMIQAKDEAKASATFIISTTAQDRDGDVVESAGCDYSNYAKNPVVLYDHGASQYPIGLAEPSRGQLSIKIDASRILSTVYFHQKTQESRDVCALVMAGVIRGASIGFRPIEADKINLDGRQGFHFKKWELTEWSPTPIGSNQEALRASLSRGVVKSQRLRQQLSPWAEAAKIWSNGTEIKNMSKQAANLVTKADEDEEDKEEKDEDLDEEAKDETADESDEEEKDDGDDSEEEETEETPKDEEEKDEQEDKPALPPPGARDMANYMLHTQGALKFSEAMRGKHEPEMQSFFDAMTEHETAGLEKIKELFAARYPDHDLEKMVEELMAKPKEDEPEESAVAKGKRARTIVKRMSKSQCVTVKDAGEFLSELGEDTGVPKSRRAGCKHHAKSLDDMMKAMETPEEEDKDEDPAAEEKALREIRRARKKLQVA